MSEESDMLSGVLFNPKKEELVVLYKQNKQFQEEFNQTSYRHLKRRKQILHQMFAFAGENIYIEPPFYCEYGTNIKIGDNFFASYDCIFLDFAKINIGNNVVFGPRVNLLCVDCPTEINSRAKNLRYSHDINIEDDVYLGANVLVKPGITIHKNVIVGCGSVVTHDLESNAVYGGNPAKKLRNINEEEMKKWRKEADCYYKRK
ncbi:MAG: sugar O-acetyltransferase [Bacilli bacterium]